MGVNFYWIHPLSEDEKQKIHKAIDSSLSYSELIQKIQDCINYSEDGQTEDTTEKVHIGKSSVGWQFLFNRKILDICTAQKKSIISWLKTGKLIDEYGEVYDPEEWWNEFVEQRMNLLDSKAYIEQYQNGVGTTSDEIINNLRFTNIYCYFC